MWVNGGLGRIRTPDPLIRSQVLYPAELPVRTRLMTRRAFKPIKGDFARPFLANHSSFLRDGKQVEYQAPAFSGE